MRLLGLAACAAAAFTFGSANAAERVNQPIDTTKLVVMPTKAAADLASQTIQLAGNTAANTIQKDGFVKTFNNLFRKPTPVTQQAGGLPQPYLYPSTQYKSFNTPQMPILMPTKR